jgi:hypothetical protein
MLWPLGPCSQPQPNRSPPSGRPARRATRQSRCCAWSSRVTDRTFGRLLRKSPCTAMPPSPILTLRRRHDRGMQATDRPLPARAGQDPPAGSERPEVARHLIALIATSWPATPAEHRGQLGSAWPGRQEHHRPAAGRRAGRHPSHHPCSAGAWLPAQVPAAFPASRPSRVRRRRSSGHHSGGRPRPSRWRSPSWAHNEQEDNAKRPNCPS